MKTPLCAVLLVCATIAAGAAAQTAQPADPAPTSTAPPAPHDSPLVKAARNSGAAPKMPKKVITNKDVKKSKGKLTVKSPPPPLPPAATTTNVETRTPSEISDAQYHARKSNDERTAGAEKRVDELQKDLAAIEQAYYAEKDLNLRDDVIQKRFAQTKRQLEAARKELADARDAAGAPAPKQ
jgi:hypothetical protein